MTAESETIGGRAAETSTSQSGAPRRQEHPGLRVALPWGLTVLLVGLAGLAYRDLLLWDPGRPGLPDVTWFFFGWKDTSPQLLYAIAGVLLFRRRQRLAEALSGEGSPRTAWPLLLGGTLLFAWGRHVDAGDLVLVSFLLVSLGAALLLFGGRFAARLLPPLLVLAFALPLPGVLSNQLVFPLQLATAEHTTWLLDAVGIPAASQGDLIQIVSGRFEVIESCSGLRSIQVLTLLAVGWVCFFQVPPLHAVLLTAAAPPIAYAVNLGRVASLVLLPNSEHALSHEMQGVATLLLGTCCLYVTDAFLLRVLPRAETRGGDDEPQECGRAADAPEARPRRARRALALAALLSGLVAASFVVPRWQAPATRDRARLALPEAIGGWRLVEQLKPEAQFLGRVQFSDRAYARYTKDGEAVRVFVGYDDRLQRDRSLLSSKNGWDGHGWHVEERTRFELAPGGPRVEALLARFGESRLLSFHWYEGIEGVWAECWRATLGLDQSAWRRPHGSLVVRVSTTLGAGDLAGRQAEERLREIARGLRAVSSSSWPPG